MNKTTARAVADFALAVNWSGRQYLYGFDVTRKEGANAVVFKSRSFKWECFMYNEGIFYDLDPDGNIIRTGAEPNKLKTV